MNTEKNILLACFLGGALGTVVALQFHYLWWLGMLTGGATGYLAFSFKDVMRAALTTYQLLHGARFQRCIIKAGLLKAGQFLAILSGIVFCATSVLAMSLIALMLFVEPPHAAATRVGGASVGPGTTVLPTPFYAVTAAGLLVLVVVLGVLVLRARDRKGACMAIIGCVAATPLVLPFTLAAILGTALVPHMARFALRFARQTFYLIHSEVRLLCLTDSLLGTAVGYGCGNAVVGGLAGAFLGWLNYRFVSVKWLKLAKA